MNTVNRPIPFELAHKLRSAAQALLADAASQPAPLASALMQEAATIQGRADDLEKDAKQVEPTEFGSIVRARHPGQPKGTERPLWQRSPVNGTHYWMSEYSDVEVWSELTDVEVLRVGLGEIPSDSQKAAQDDAYMLGRSELRTQIHERLLKLLADAITGERKNAFEKAIQAVEELAP